MVGFLVMCASSRVAPVRERGLKCTVASTEEKPYCRSREGAWIEIVTINSLRQAFMVAPVRERGLKSNWCKLSINERFVAPARERGLKCAGEVQREQRYGSLPRGSVD